MSRTVLALLFSTAVMLGTVAQAATAPAALRYPPTPRDNIVNTYFGTRVPAPYQWMENLTDPRLQPWIAAQNKLTDGYLAKLPLREAIYTRLKTMWNYPKEGTPVQRGGLLFFSRNSGEQNQASVYVQQGPDGKPRLLIDADRISPNGDIALAAWDPSPDGRYVVYALAKGGSDWQTLHVLDVATGKTLPQAVRWVKFSNIAWSGNSAGFFYSRYPAPPKGKAIEQRLAEQALYYHWINRPQADDKLIYRRPDQPEWIIDGSTTEHGHYLFINFQFNITRNGLYVMDLGKGAQPNLDAPVRPLFTSNDAQYTPVGVLDGTLYVQTDNGAPMGRLIAMPLDDPSPAHWRTVIPQEKDAVLESVHLADGHLLVHRMVVAKSRLALYDSTGKLLRELPLPDAMGTVMGISARKHGKQVYYAFTSFLRPGEVVRYDVADGSQQTIFKPQVAFDPAHYTVSQVFYPSTGGVEVPMFIVHRKGLKLDGSNPTILYGYGGFDITLTPYFSPTLAVWLKLGGVYAMPNLRGGGVYGQAWHHAGMLQHKQHVFDDFANAARWLIAHRYTSTPHLGIMGYSNGGLLTGASVTQQPHLFGAVYIGHGVLDMLRFQKFSGGEYWIGEYGDADKSKADFDWLYAYSPLQNLHPGTCYPPTLITTSTDDDRVVPSNAYKFAAQMQRDQGCANPILLHVAHSTSHIYMPVHKHLRHDADNWGFIGSAIGMQAPR